MQWCGKALLEWLFPLETAIPAGRCPTMREARHKKLKCENHKIGSLYPYPAYMYVCKESDGLHHREKVSLCRKPPSLPPSLTLLIPKPASHTHVSLTCELAAHHQDCTRKLTIQDGSRQSKRCTIPCEHMLSGSQ